MSTVPTRSVPRESRRARTRGARPAGPRLSMADRRRQLITIAAGLFAARGFAGTTTRSLARAAGVTEGVIFQHFADKDALYDAILTEKATEAGADRWLDALDRLADAGDPPAFLRALYAGIVRRHDDDPGRLPLMLFAALEGRSLSLRLQASEGLRVYEAVERAVLSGQRAGRIRPAPAPALVRAVLSIPLAFILERRVLTPPWPPVDTATMIDEGVRFALAGLTAGEGSSSGGC
jgi:AcrR family transcriptional regulator